MMKIVKLKISEFEEVKEMSFYNHIFYRHIPTGDLYKEHFRDDEPYGELYIQEKNQDGSVYWKSLGMFEWNKGLTFDKELEGIESREYVELI